MIRVEIAGAVLHVGLDCKPDCAAALAPAPKVGPVIFPDLTVRTVIAAKQVDFRKGHDGLASVAQAELGFARKAGRDGCIPILAW